jgi:NagD protein
MAKAYLCDMDGVLIRGGEPIPGANAFIERMRKAEAPFMVLTNNSRRTPRDHQARLNAMGLELEAEHIFTSAQATGQFLHWQRPEGSAFVIGEAGLTTALHEVGYVLTAHDPNYVVLGETTNYSFEQIQTAVRLVAAGARFIATNPDVSGPSPEGIVPGCGAVAAMITAATGVSPYFVGKPNPFMMRSALRRLGTHSENTVMIGDRMETDVIAGMESGMETILVLTGMTREEEVSRFPYRPSRVLKSVAEIKP